MDTKLKIGISILCILLAIWTINYVMYVLGAGVFAGFSCGDSMEPTVSSGDIIVYESADEIEVGDVVLFYDHEVQSDVTHRITNIVRGETETKYKIQGDNRMYGDGWYNKSQIRGKTVGKVANIKQLCG